MSDKLKKLTGKNPRDFEPVVFDMLNNPDVELFKELVQQDDYLFDFVKNNVAKRISAAINAKNYKTLLKFLKYYSPSYEECIIGGLVSFADEDLTDKMLDLFENGTTEEKTYCAKFFSYIQDPLAITYLKDNAYSEDTFLSSNCASTLAIMGDRDIYNQALEKLKSGDEFEQLNAVKFLSAFGDNDAIENIINTAKSSTMPENIAGELLYLTDVFSILEKNKTNALFILNSIINGLGEILPLAQVFDFRLYEVLEYIKTQQPDSEYAITLINAKEKFNTLTENDEYLFDEQKDIKQEILDIKKLLSDVNIENLSTIAQQELKTDSLFINTAIELVCTTEKARELLKSDNQTVILKSLEYLKSCGNLTGEDKSQALQFVTNENIKSVINAM